jgi:hypothetical protein
MKDESFVLVGFGKHDMKDILSWIDTPQEEDALKAPVKWPPRYRPERICDKDDFDRFEAYMEWIISKEVL